MIQCERCGLWHGNSKKAHVRPMSIRLDSYQCDNCQDFFHLEQPTEEEKEPAACPYCGHNKVTWRSDNLWVLNEAGSST